MKRRIEYSASSSVTLIGRILLVGSVLGFASACAHRDAARSDTTAAPADSMATASAATPAAAPAVESVSAGETSLTSDPKPTPATPATPAPATVASKPAAPVVHHAKHADTATKATTTASSTTTTAAAPAKADTGNTATKSDTGASADHLLVTPTEYEGWKMFAVYCYRCHGVDAMGGGIAPNLRHSVSSEGSVTHDVFITTVTNGRVEKGMPTWKALLSPEQMEDLWQYVTARSSGKLAPGRPHMSGGKNP
ncbi:MAG: c-type cytochrome [Gemmatimonadaceae bacterium]